MGGDDKLARLLDMLPGSAVSFELSVEALLDGLVALYTDAAAIQRPSENFTFFLNRYKPLIERLRSGRINADDFENVKVLGRGGFGEVRLVKYKPTGKAYAMKVLVKKKMLGGGEAAFFLEERDIMTQSGNPWVTGLQYAFQDAAHLYLVMEFIQGGNLLKLMQEQEGALTEETAKFYIAETIKCVDEVHKLGYIHRDVKPDNMMIDEMGHLKITDFGSCIRYDPVTKQVKLSGSAVGTPEYISPEVLKAQEKNMGHGVECDFWAVGIMLYEMLVGDLPFFSESLVEMYGIIMNFKKHFKIPDDIGISAEGRDLISKLICEKEQRLGRNGIEELQSHPFFKGIDWNNLRGSTPPVVPTFVSDTDTSCFEEVEEEDAPVKQEKRFLSSSNAAAEKTTTFTGNEMPFIGYSFNRDFSSLQTGGDGAPPVTPMTPRAPGSLRRMESEAGLFHKQLKDLNSELESWKTKHERQKEMTASLEAKVSSLSVELDSKQAAVENERTRSKRLEKEKLDLQKANAVLELKASESNSRNNNDELSVQVSQLQQQVADEQKKSAEMKEKLNNMIATSGSSNLELEQLREKFNKKTTQMKEQEAQIRSAQEEKLLLNEKIDTLNVNLEVESNQRKSLENKMSTLEKKLELELAKQKELVDSSNKAAANVTVLNNQMEELRSQLTAKEAQLEASEKAKQLVQREKAVMEVELDNLQKSQQSQRSNSDSLMKDMEQRLREHETEKQNLDDMMNRLRKQKDAAVAESETLKQQLAELAAGNNAIANNSGVSSETPNSNGNEAELKGKLEQMNAELARVKKELEDEVTARNNARLNASEGSEGGSGRSESRTARAQRIAMKSQLDDAMAELEKLKAENTSLQETVAKVRGGKAASVGDGQSLPSLDTPSSASKSESAANSEEVLEHLTVAKEAALRDLKLARSQLDETNDKLAQLESTYNSLLKEKTLLAMELADSRQNEEKQADLAKQLRQQKDDLTKQLAEVTAEKNQLSEYNQQLEKQIGDLEDEIAGLDKEADEELKHSKEVLELKLKLEVTLKKNQEELNSLKQKHEETTQDLENVLSVLEGKLQEEVEKRTRVEQELEKITESSVQLKNNNEELKNQMESNNAMREENNKLKTEMAMLTLEHNSSKAKLESEEEEKTEITAQLQKVSGELTVQIKSNSDLQEENNKLLDKIHALQESENELVVLRDTLEATQEELRVESEKAANKQRENDKLKQNLAATVDTLARHLPQGNVKAKKDDKEVRKLKSEILKYQQQQSLLENKIKTLEAQTKKLEADLNDAHEKLSNKSESGSIDERRGSDRSEVSSISRESVSREVATSKDAAPAPTATTAATTTTKEYHTGLAHSLSVFSSFRSSAKNRKSITEDTFSPVMLTEGALKMRQPKAARFKNKNDQWKKMYCVIKDMRFYVLEKSGDKITNDTLYFDLKSFAFEIAPVDIDSLRNLEENEAIASFGLREIRAAPAGLEASTSATKLNVSDAKAEVLVADLEAKLKSLEAEKETEKRVLSGASQLMKVAKGKQKLSAQEQFQGSQLKLAEVERQIANVTASLEKARKQLEEKKKEEPPPPPVEAPMAIVVPPPSTMEPPPKKPSPTKEAASDDDGDEDDESDEDSESEAGESEEKKKAKARLKAKIEKEKERLAELQASGVNRKEINDVLKRIRLYREQLNDLSGPDSKVEINDDDDPQAVSATKPSSSSSAEPQALSAAAIVSSSSAAGAAAVGAAKVETHEFCGHKFVSKVYGKPILCRHCHQLLKVHATSLNEGFCCTVCDYICHRNCYTLTSVSCRQYQLLKNAPTSYFLAKDEREKLAWTLGINQQRQTALGTSPPSANV